MKKLIALFSILLPWATVAQAQFGAESLGSKVELHSSVTSVKPGDSFQLSAEITHTPSYWIYYNGSVGAETPMSFQFKAPEGVTFGIAQFAKPKLTNKEGKLTFTYPEETKVLFEVAVSDSFKGESIGITATMTAQLCNKQGCLRPSDFSSSIDVKVGETVKSSVDFSAQQKEVAKIAKDIRLTVSNTDKEVTLTFLTDRDLGSVKDLYFTDQSAIAHPSTSQQFKPIDGGYAVTLARNVLFDEVVAIPEVVTGLLFSKSGTIFNKNALLVTSAQSLEEATQQPTVAQKSTQSTHSKDGFLGNVRAFTEAEKANNKELYKGDQKINYVTLAQAKDLAKGVELTSTGSVKGNDQTLFTAMFFAFIGGMILNLMPCVFPVLGLKVMGFAQMAGNDPKKIKAHGLVFTLGVVASMWILAGAILAVKAGLEKAGEGSIQWGAQMQNPIFVSLIILLLFIMGLNMYGVFEIGTKLTSAGGELQNKKGYSGSFFSGILTTLIATPCSGPFLGAAMSYTLGLPAFEALLVFTVFALGIAFPYLLLAFIPALINKLPRPGAWMEVMKKSMAFPLFATAVFFLGTFGNLTGVDGMFWLSMAMVTVGLALWAYGTWSNPYIKSSKRYAWGFGFPAVVAIAAGFMTFHALQQKGTTKDGWHQGVVEFHLGQNKPVWVDYTAEW